MCSDPDVTYYPQRSVCYADMNAAAARRIYDELHGEGSHMLFHDGSFEVWSPRFSTGMPFKHDDGVSIWMSTEDLSPDDDFLSGGA